jgi:hypothetical protein
MNLKNKVPIFVILFVSASAFIAGFYQSDFSSKAANLRQTRADLEFQLARMQDTVNTLIVSEIIVDLESWGFYNDAGIADVELNSTWDNITWSERNVLTFTIIDYLLRFQEYQLNLITGKMYQHFQISSSDYVIASIENDGYDYKITKSIFEEFEPVYETTAEERVGWFFTYDIFSSKSYAPTYFIELKRVYKGYPEDYFKRVFYKPVENLQEEITKISQLIEENENRADTIQLAVSITTISVILSTAMANRINENKTEYDLSIIKATLSDEKVEIVAKSDKISIPVLLTAAILSSLGVLIPILL